MTTSADFQALFKRGKRIDRPSFLLLWRETTEPTRVGFAVSRQIRGAVERNRVKRRLREAYRAARDAAPPRTALVLVGRSGARSEPFDVLAREVRSALYAVEARRSAT